VPERGKAGNGLEQREGAVERSGRQEQYQQGDTTTRKDRMASSEMLELLPAPGGERLISLS
jgi:hypothetical protein